MPNAIRVLLQDDVENLGSSGEIVRVRPGYARNFLIPRGLAVPATAGNLARADELKRRHAARLAETVKIASELAEKLKTLSIKIERAVGAENKMYGSVTTRDIAEAFAQKGVELDKRKIELNDPIREVGTFEIPVKLHATVTATLKLEVAKKS